MAESSTEGGEGQKEPQNFLGVVNKLKREQLPPNERKDLETKRDQMIEEALQEGVFDNAQSSVLGIVRGSNWDGVYSDLLTAALNLETSAQARDYPEDKKDEWQGMVRSLVEGAADHIALLGIEKKGAEAGPEWLNKHGYPPDRVGRLKRNAEVKRGDILLPEGAEFLVGENLRKQQEMSQPPGGIGPDQAQALLKKQEELVERLSQQEQQRLEHQERQLGYQEQQIEMMRGSYDGFIQGEKVRSHVNPEQFDQQLPIWYKELLEEEQDLLRARLNVNYLAATKRDRGMSTTEVFVPEGFGLERDALEYAMKNMPGFREVAVTMMHDIFELKPSLFIDKDGNKKTLYHLVISGSPEKRDPITKKKIADATGGYAIVSSEKLLKQYKARLVEAMEHLLHNDPSLQVEARNMRVSIKDFAIADVSFFDNLLFSLGVYDSGDEKRAITPGDRNVYSEAVRTLLMPGIKGKKAKWLTERGSKNPGVSEEDFGGPIGTYIRENAAANRPGVFRTDPLTGERELAIKLIPDRLSFSVFDEEYFNENAEDKSGNLKWYAGKNISEAMLAALTTDIYTDPNNITIYDFQDGPNTINFEDLASYELLGSYGDTTSAAVKIFKHLTSDKPEDRLNGNAFINALIKARKNAILNRYYLDEDLVFAGIVNVLAPKDKPNGLVGGIPEIVLNIDEDAYDSTVNAFLNDSRLFEGMEDGFRERVLERLHANDNRRTSSLLRYAFPGIAKSRFINEREQLRKQGANNIKMGR